MRVFFPYALAKSRDRSKACMQLHDCVCMHELGLSPHLGERIWVNNVTTHNETHTHTHTHTHSKTYAHHRSIGKKFPKKLSDNADPDIHNILLSLGHRNRPCYNNHIKTISENHSISRCLQGLFFTVESQYQYYYLYKDGF